MKSNEENWKIFEQYGIRIILLVKDFITFFFKIKQIDNDSIL